MKFNEIDWSAMWQEESAGAHFRDTKRKEHWDKRAEKFNRSIDKVTGKNKKMDNNDYIAKMLARVEVDENSTVLDIGCGPGTLALPLAHKAKSVTGLDLSSEMIKHLKANAEKNGLDNITCINSEWEEAVKNNLVGKHDVVVASRSLMPVNINEAMKTIVSLTGKAAYLTFPVIHLPFDWIVYKEIGRGHKKHPPYIYILNTLYQMGIRANLEILHSKVVTRYKSVEEGLDDLQWRTDPFNEDELAKASAFLKAKFAEQNNPEVFVYEGYSRWALVWWRTCEQD